MPVVAEYAKSNRSSCRSCSNKIAVKSLRLGLISKGRGGVDMTRWHHFDCFPTDSESIASVDDIQGLSALEVRVSLHFCILDSLGFFSSKAFHFRLFVLTLVLMVTERRSRCFDEIGGTMW